MPSNDNRSLPDEAFGLAEDVEKIRAMSTTWRIVCWFCSFVLVAGFISSEESPLNDPPCGASTEPSVGVKITRAGQGVGSAIHVVRDAEVEPAEVKERMGQIGATLGRWLAIVFSRANNGPQAKHPETVKMEKELVDRQGKHALACAPRPELLLSMGAVAGSPNVSVGTMNVLLTNGGKRVATNIREALQEADVLGLQELRGKHRVTIPIALAGLGKMTPDGNATSIVYNTSRVTLLEWHEQRVMEGARVEGGRIPGKMVVWARFQEKQSSHTFWVVNLHMYWDVATGGKPDKGKPRRLAAYRRQLERSVDGHGSYPGLVALTRKGEAVMVTGDFNVDAGGDQRHRAPGFPFVMMNSRGFASSAQLLRQEVSTHGGASLDHVYSHGALPVAQKKRRNPGSDHDVLVVSYSQAKRETQA